MVRHQFTIGYECLLTVCPLSSVKRVSCVARIKKILLSRAQSLARADWLVAGKLLMLVDGDGTSGANEREERERNAVKREEERNKREKGRM